MCTRFVQLLDVEPYRDARIVVKGCSKLPVPLNSYVELSAKLYLDDDKLEWARATGEHLESEADEMHRDSNGALLQTGDSVVLIKSLDVKGSQINAKIGTVVKNIRVVHDNTEQIEGKIEGQQIVLLTKFVRKSS